MFYLMVAVQTARFDHHSDLLCSLSLFRQLDSFYLRLNGAHDVTKHHRNKAAFTQCFHKA